MKVQKGVQMWLNSSCNLGARWGSAFNAMNQRLYPGKEIRCPFCRRLDGPQVQKTSPHKNSIPALSSQQTGTVPTELWSEHRASQIAVVSRNWLRNFLEQSSSRQVIVSWPKIPRNLWDASLITTITGALLYILSWAILIQSTVSQSIPHHWGGNWSS